ncbi:Transmembrane amino acid transporter protein [Tritrichomonas foetus]|uniref:Transmembrane amino acid transporter protein n=1 Tax=Tritrichomonas foetus TaxID=1144522 RepID=A0A1J4JPX0_9EUKA|nr:Transmembrane amino acid transporter protein [Tritrichomonas foetus]|eukprot:OHT01207.1 Transmembrane amino acid transporter protein [Tritrichomonas foetus]
MNESSHDASLSNLSDSGSSSGSNSSAIYSNGTTKDVESGTSIDNNTTTSSSDEDFEKITKVEATSAGHFTTLMNLLGSLLGAGILSVPNSFGSAGMIPSLAIIILIAALSYIASVMDIKLHQKIDCKGFDELVEKIMGKWGSISYSIVVIIFLDASMIAYLIIGGDMITSWFAFGGIDITSFVYRLVMILVYGLAVPIALMVPKTFVFIGMVSAASNLFIIFYIAATIVKMAQMIPDQGIAASMVLAKLDMTTFSAIGVYALTFALPTVVIPLLSPYSPEYKARRNVVLECFIITATLTIFPSILMYMIFGSEAEGNILNSFPSNDILFTVVRVGFFLIVSFSFPVLGKSVMCNWSQLLYKMNHANELKGSRFWIVFSLSALIPLAVAMFLPQAKPAIAVGGALGGCLACFTYPSILWVLSSGKKWTERTNVLSIIFAIVGLVFAIVATYQAVVDAIKAFKEMN